MAGTMIQRILAAIRTELRGQGEERGFATEARGSIVQVGGSFDAEPLARAILAAMREPTDDMNDAIVDVMPDRPNADYSHVLPLS